MMAIRKFGAHKFLGYGCYSFAYSVTYTSPHDKVERYASSQIANGSVIFEETDIWSYGVLMGQLIGKSIRREEMNFEVGKQASIPGRWHFSEFSKLSGGLQDLFNQVIA
ncbi:hypothetical protein ACTXT7_004287 [Hymenolepis weldensis]